jgi:HD-GYP domain-containing protein (c-di-GMP phosphodiesterase class II)
MTHQQPYQPVRTINEALHELHFKAGTQFDPVLVPIFVQMMTDKKHQLERPSINNIAGKALDQVAGIIHDEIRRTND